MQITKRAKIIWGAAITLLLIFSFLLWTQQTPPPLPPISSTAKPKLPPQKSEGPESDAPPQGQHQASTNPAVIVEAGNLGKITALKSQVEELKLELQIAELTAKKDGATRSQRITEPLPSLSLPAFTPPSPSPQASVPTSNSRRANLAVLSVQGVGDNLSATVRTGSGQTVVRIGSRLGDSVVTAISRQAVLVKRGNQINTLPFE
ncbi:hypothetical protein [Desulfovibrio falkowii]|uniref:Type IV pilus biogenesis protein PilP n=1 Tax=Desulfovibrio falkowii TaxID=3136602 RepID=A0ABQ0E610_9BACT